jgi:uncharacterized membrane protein YoaK (UPF0700 family)
VFVGQAHSFTQQARLAITLAWVAGYTNIISFLTCGTVTSHVSGTVSQFGLDLVQGRWNPLGFAAFLLATFLAGALASGFCTEIGRRRGWQSIYVLPMSIQAALLASLAIGLEVLEQRPIADTLYLYTMTGLASLAMGLQNATITRISSGVVRTTHMTGVCTDLGLEGAQLFFWLRDRRAAGSAPLGSHPTLKRLALLASVAASFALGSGLGALAYEHIPRLAMFPPVLFLLWVIVQDLRTPICEIEESPLDGLGIDLPPGMEVYTLRKDPARPAALHRLPDLLAWADRLSPATRVVILDLDESTQIDENAALELRAVVDRFERGGRHLIVSGVGSGRFETLRRAGTGDVLDATNLCPELELAIARGFMLLDPPIAAHA